MAHLPAYAYQQDNVVGQQALFQQPYQSPQPQQNNWLMQQFPPPEQIRALQQPPPTQPPEISQQPQLRQQMAPQARDQYQGIGQYQPSEMIPQYQSVPPSPRFQQPWQAAQPALPQKQGFYQPNVVPQYQPWQSQQGFQQPLLTAPFQPPPPPPPLPQPQQEQRFRQLPVAPQGLQQQQLIQQVGLPQRQLQHIEYPSSTNEDYAIYAIPHQYPLQYQTPSVQVNSKDNIPGQNNQPSHRDWLIPPPDYQRTTQRSEFPQITLPDYKKTSKNKSSKMRIPSPDYPFSTEANNVPYVPMPDYKITTTNTYSALIPPPDYHTRLRRSRSSVENRPKPQLNRQSSAFPRVRM